MTDFPAEIVERVARALYDHEHASLLEDNARRWALENRDAWLREYWRKAATAALAALPLSPAALEALMKGEAVVVPCEPTPDMTWKARVEVAQYAKENSLDFAHEAAVVAYAVMISASPYRIPPPKEPGNG